jgi:hypothetical protein
MGPRPPSLHVLAPALLAATILLAAAPVALAAAGTANGLHAIDSPTEPAATGHADAATPAATRHADAATPTATPSGSVLVVDGDDDGDDAYATVQAAVDAADAGDTVAVRPGTYAGTVRLDETVTVVARRGATLDGTSAGADAAAFTVVAGSDAAPTVAGFTVTGYATGVNGSRTAGDWTVRNVTVRGTEVGVDAYRAAGDWTVADSSFTGHRYAVYAWYAGGEWTVRDSTFRANGQGVYAARADGAWVVADSSFRANTDHGVDATATAGNWTVVDSAFLDNRHAITAEGSRGHWRVANTAFAGSDFSALWATDVQVEGDATGNWWGTPDGADRDDCVGNVDCSDHLTEAPVDDEAYLGRVDTEFDVPEAAGGRWNTSVDSTTATETPPIGGGVGLSSGPLLTRWQTLLVVAVVALVPVLLLRRYGLPSLA